MDPLFYNRWGVGGGTPTSWSCSGRDMNIFSGAKKIPGPKHGNEIRFFFPNPYPKPKKFNKTNIGGGVVLWPTVGAKHRRIFWGYKMGFPRIWEQRIGGGQSPPTHFE